MLIPATDHVARTCKPSTCDQGTGRPTPASFGFRKDLEDGSWKEHYLSVNWLELLCPEPASLPEKLDKLRKYLTQVPPPPYPIFKLSKTSSLAALPVAAVHGGSVGKFPTSLECRTEQKGPNDPHAGIHPTPGVGEWPVPEEDESEHLAVCLFLFQSIAHWEKAFP